MSHLDDELRDAFRREEPSEGFASRVLARAATESVPEGAWTRLAHWFRLPGARLAFAGALCVMVLGGIRYEQAVQQRARGEAAKQQLMLALRVTSSKLESVHAKVRGATAPYSVEQQ